MHRLSSVFFALVLVALGYNYYQTGQIRRDLEGIRTELRALKAGRAGLQSAELLPIISQARRHLMRANALLSVGKTEQAKVETDRALELMEKASKLSGNGGSGPENRVAQVLARMREEAEKAWKNISAQAAKQKERK